MPPPSPEGFCELSIREQFAYVKPVIKAILNETYPPARDRHQAFMQGGSSRLRLRKAATGKGDLTAREISQLGRALQSWVLGPMHSQKGSCPSLGDLESENGLVSSQNGISKPALTQMHVSLQTFRWSSPPTLLLPGIA
jgi:hypothetical protein